MVDLRLVDDNLTADQIEALDPIAAARRNRTIIERYNWRMTNDPEYRAAVEKMWQKEQEFYKRHGRPEHWNEEGER